ncbi:MAG: hypothetical protein JOY72_10420 [Actinobacteria bacterium]|nr:hypothetical protein [Actinomycetota bacterium]
MSEPAKVEAIERVPLALAAAVPHGRPLFLRWLCLATASGLALASLTLAGFARGVSGAPLAVTFTIVAAAAALAGFAGVLHWRADAILPTSDARKLEHIRHDAQLVFYGVALFQVLGMIGALLGYRQQTSSAALPDSQAAVHALTLGLGNGLTATLTGVVCSVIVWVMFLHLQHALDRPR